MNEELNHVECSVHGKQQTTYVCQHLVQSLRDDIPRGFWWATESPDNPRPDAWCSECEEHVNDAGEWNDEAEDYAGIKILCGSCYDNVKELNLGNDKKWWEFWK